MYEIGSEFNFEEVKERRNLVELFADRAEKCGRYVEFLRCGRDAIGFVADDIIAKYKGDIRVFLPALCCDSMVKPFEVRGLKITYYKLDENLIVDKDDLFEKIDSYSEAVEPGNHIPVVLVMNFFGTAPVSDLSAAVKERCSSAILIEDVTHILLEPENYMSAGSAADYHVGSIRKWIGVPDGAIAVSREEFVMGALTGDTDFTELRAMAQQEKTEYLETGDQELKSHFRKLLADAEESLSDGLDPFLMSDMSADYLKSIELDNIIERRSLNYRCLYKVLSALPLNGKAFRLLPEIENGDNGFEYAYTPFMLPIVLDVDFIRRSAITEEGKSITRDAFEKRLAECGIYAPVLWPVSEEAAVVCGNSKDFSENMLAFWIDQRYDRFDMEHVAEVFSGELTRL